MTGQATGETVVTSGITRVVQADVSLTASGDGPSGFSGPAQSQRGAVVTRNRDHLAGRVTPIDTRKRPSQRYAISALLKDAAACVERLLAAAQSGDFRDRTIAGIDLLDYLTRLWRHRELRETQWGDTVNFLQSALAGVAIEDLTPTQGEAIAEVLLKYLMRPAIDDDDVDSVVDSLSRVDLDPFYAISWPSGLPHM